jgi:hypothetical protein
MPRKNQPGCPCGCSSSGSCCKFQCGSNMLPQKDLVLKVVGNPETLFFPCPTEEYVFPSNGVSWNIICGDEIYCSYSMQADMRCNQGSIFFSWFIITAGGCGFVTGSIGGTTGPFGGLTIVDFTADPFHLHLQPDPPNCPNCLPAFTDIYVDDPDPLPPGTPLMCQSFEVSPCAVCVVGTFTVSVYDMMGGTLLASGTTSSNPALVHLAWAGSPGPYYVTVTAPGFVDFAGTYTLSCNGSTLLGVLNTVAHDPLTMTDSVFFPGGETATWTDDLGTVLPYYDDGGYMVPLTGIQGWATSMLSVTCFNGVVIYAFYFLVCTGGNGGGFRMFAAWNGVLPGGSINPNGWVYPWGSQTVISSSCSPLMQVSDVFNAQYCVCPNTPPPCNGHSTITWSS